MSRPLNYMVICDLYTLEEIQTEVDFWKEQLKNATVAEYKKDTSQGMQQVESAELKQIESTLSIYMKALQCKKGGGSIGIVSANFGGHV